MPISSPLDVSTSVNVTFWDGVTDPELDSLQLILDDERNDEATEFVYGSDAYIVQFPSGNFDTYVSVGTFQKIASRVPVPVEGEFVIFPLVKEADLAYTPVPGSVRLSWRGKDAGGYYMNGKTINVYNKIVAVAKCDYLTYCDIFKVNYNGSPNLVDFEEESKQYEVPILLVVDRTGLDENDEITHDIAYIRIEYVHASYETREVILTIKDYCSGKLVPYANVVLSGEGYPATAFTADAYGEVNFGLLRVGEYDLQITADGYLPSDEDSLSNDSFIVTSEGVSD